MTFVSDTVFRSTDPLELGPEDWGSSIQGRMCTFPRSSIVMVPHGGNPHHHPPPLGSPPVIAEQRPRAWSWLKSKTKQMGRNRLAFSLVQSHLGMSCFQLKDVMHHFCIMDVSAYNRYITSTLEAHVIASCMYFIVIFHGKHGELESL